MERLKESLFFHMLKPSEMKDLNTTPFAIATLIGWIVLINISVWQHRRWRMKCSSCKK